MIYIGSGGQGVFIFGAYLIDKSGKRFLRAPELLIQAGYSSDTALVIDEAGQELQVRLPKGAANLEQNARFTFEELEVL